MLNGLFVNGFQNVATVPFFKIVLHDTLLEQFLVFRRQRASHHLFWLHDGKSDVRATKGAVLGVGAAGHCVESKVCASKSHNTNHIFRLVLWANQSTVWTQVPMGCLSS